MHFISFVDGLPVTANALGDKYSIYVAQTPKLRGARKGMGAFVFYLSLKEGGRNTRAAWNTQLVMAGDSPIELLPLSSGGAIEMGLPDSFPMHWPDDREHGRIHCRTDSHTRHV